MASLEGWNSTIELHPHLNAIRNRPVIAMAGAGFEPAKALPPDLQSGPFGRSGIPPFTAFSKAFLKKLAVGLEPATTGLQNRDSTVELR